MTFVRREYLTWLEEVPSQGIITSTTQIQNQSRKIFPQAVSVTYRLNDIPVAVVSVTFGKSFSGQITDEQVQSDIRLIRAWSENRVQLRIINEIKEFNLETGQTTSKVDVLFQGYILAPSVQLMRNHAGYDFQMQHWLVDLSSGSILTHFAVAHPSNTTRQARIYSPRTTSGSTTSRLATESIIRRLGLGRNWRRDVFRDIWANGMKSIFAHFATVDLKPLKIVGGTRCSDQLNSVPNVVRQALSRIQGPFSTDSVEANQLSRNYDQFGGPITFRSDIEERVVNVLQRNIADFISNKKIEEYSGETFWHKLMTFCSQFGLVLIPRAEDALIVPQNIGLSVSDLNNPDISESEIEEMSWTAFQQNTIRGMGIMTNRQSSIGAVSTINQDPIRNVEFGCHIATDDADKGMVVFTRPPAWLANISVGALSRFNPSRIVRAERTMYQIRTEISDQESEISSEIVEFKNRGYSDILNAYAKLLYLENNLKHRILGIACPIRTDIAVGSMIKVGLDSSKMVNRLNLPTQSVTGLVAGLTMIVDRSRMLATTTYHMDYVRTREQMEDPDLINDGHPIFRTKSRIIGFS